MPIYGAKQLEKDVAVAAANAVVNSVYKPKTPREEIAGLIRRLTYRELKQIAIEIAKCQVPTAGSAKIENIDLLDLAQTLDDWAYMVQEEKHDQE